MPLFGIEHDHCWRKGGTRGTAQPSNTKLLVFNFISRAIFLYLQDARHSWWKSCTCMVHNIDHKSSRRKNISFRSIYQCNVVQLNLRGHRNTWKNIKHLTLIYLFHFWWLIFLFFRPTFFRFVICFFFISVHIILLLSSLTLRCILNINDVKISWKLAWF